MYEFSDEQIALAASNYEAQEHLIRELRNAFQMSRLTLEELADELELSTEDALAWISGEVDLTLSELRHLANAVDAQVTYRVGALRTMYASRIAEVQSNAPWLETEPFWASTDPVVPAHV